MTETLFAGGGNCLECNTVFQFLLENTVEACCHLYADDGYCKVRCPVMC